MKSLAIIPAFNESENIAGVVNEIRLHQPSMDLLVIDDGSTDATARLAREAGAPLLSIPFNLGYGAAAQTGFLYALERNYDACVLCDGDGQHDPRYIQSLLDLVESGKADLALGSRFTGKASPAISAPRLAGIRLFSTVASLLTGQPITDPTSGFQAANRRLMEYFASDNYPEDFPDADTIIKLVYAGFRVAEVPVPARPRLKGRSMHGIASSAYYLYKMFLSILIALTLRRKDWQGGTYAIGNKASDLDREPGGNADDSAPRASQAP